MKQVRITYFIQLILIFLLFILFSQKYFLTLGILLLLIPLVFRMIMEYQAKGITVSMDTDSNVACGKQICLRFHVDCKYRFRFIRGMICEVEIQNYLFHDIQTKSYLLEFGDSGFDFETYMNADSCGRIVFRLKKVELLDLLKLFAHSFDTKYEAYTTVYPKTMNSTVYLENDTTGSEDISGNQLNKKGNDPSEVMDIRPYIAGDDIRSIHWKLSSKVDQWMIREAVEPMHYDVALLPDLSLVNQNGFVSKDEINAAIAISISIGRELLKKHISFCLILVGKDGIQQQEIQSETDLMDAVVERMSTPISEKENMGFHYFVSEHLENKFSHLIEVNAGETNVDIAVLNGTVSSCVLTLDETIDSISTTRSGTVYMLQVPVKDSLENTVHIIC